MKAKVYSEVALVEQAASDLDAFGDLVERYRGTIFRQCLSRVNDRQYAEDLAQEAFIRAYLNLKQLRDPMLFAAWLRRIASNLCSEFLRSPARREHATDEIYEMESNPTQGSIGLQTLLDQLPTETQRCLELFYDRGMSYVEISAELGLSVASVRSRLHQARAFLREEMAELAPEERSAFTKCVVEKLEELQTGTEQVRVRAAQGLREGLGEDHYSMTLAILRGEGPPFTHPRAGAWDIVLRLEAAIKDSKKFRSPEIRDALVEIMLNHEMEEMRLKATNVLVAQRDPAAIPYLQQAIEALENPREVVASAKSAITQLQKLDSSPAATLEASKMHRDLTSATSDRKARLELMQSFAAALEDPSSKVRNQAIKALVELGDKRAAPKIAKLLNDPLEGPRNAAAIALGQLKSATAVPALVEVMRTSEETRLLQTCLIALGEIGDPSGLPAILEMIEARGGNLLGMAAHKGIVISLASHETLPQVKETFSRIAMKYPQWDFSWVYPEALAKAADERDVPEVISVIESNPPKRSLKMLAKALGRIGDPRALDTLTILLLMAEYGAAGALVKFGKPGLDALKEGMKSENAAVRIEAYQAIYFAHGDELVRKEDNGAVLELLKKGTETEKTTKTRMYVKAAYAKVTNPGIWKRQP